MKPDLMHIPVLPFDSFKFEALRAAWRLLPQNADAQTILEAARYHERRLRDEDYDKRYKRRGSKC